MGGMREFLSKLICLPSGKGSAVKVKLLLPKGANYFVLEWTTFQKDQVVVVMVFYP